jgi:L-fucose mutarotase/ribose pyranase (RbsD/FucU family)
MASAAFTFKPLRNIWAFAPGFFDTLVIYLKNIIRIIVCYATSQQIFSIVRSLGFYETSILKLLKKLFGLIPDPDFLKNKLGYKKNVQVDETMLKYKCNSHRGQSAWNKKGILCIVEYKNYNKKTKAFAVVFPNKRQTVIVPFIINNVSVGSIIHTD